MNKKIKRLVLVLILLGLTIFCQLDKRLELLASDGVVATISESGAFMLDGEMFINFPEYGEVTYQVRLSDCGYGPVVNGVGYYMIEFTWDDDELQTDGTLYTPLYFNNVTVIEITLTKDTVIFHGLAEDGSDIHASKIYQKPVYCLLIMLDIPDTSRLAVSGSDVIYNNIDHPYTLDQIKSTANIIVYDSYYGDITDLLEVEEDNYSANKSTPGSFDILYSATNPSGLTAYYLLTIINQDLTAPNVSGPNDSTISYKQVITNDDILALYSVSDNWDHNVSFKVETSDYTVNMVGCFTFKLVATDMFENKATTYHTLRVIDDVAPEFKDCVSESIKVNFDMKYNDADFKFRLEAIDEIDGDITDRIKIKSSNFKNGVIGVYNVVFEVSDEAGNLCEYTRTFEVITTYIPIFYVSKEIVYIKEGFELTIDQIAEEMARQANIVLASYDVIENDYTGNEAVEGQYKIVLKITDIYNEETYHAFLLEVFVPKYEESNRPWYQFVIDIGKWIYNNIIRHIINFFIVIWNYTVGLVFDSLKGNYLFRI